MPYSNQGSFQQQFRFLRRQFLQDGDLPFSNILSEEIVTQALTALGVCWLDRVYTPLVTLWVFLGQVLSQDHSCRWAVARLIAHRISRGQKPCSAETGAYCRVHNPIRRNPAWAFPWHESRPCFLWPAVQFSIWESVATLARVKASWGCYATCGTSFAQAMSCLPIASCVLGQKC